MTSVRESYSIVADKYNSIEKLEYNVKSSENRINALKTQIQEEEEKNQHYKRSIEILYDNINKLSVNITSLLFKTGIVKKNDIFGDEDDEDDDEDDDDDDE